MKQHQQDVVNVPSIKKSIIRPLPRHLPTQYLPQQPYSIGLLLQTKSHNHFPWHIEKLIADLLTKSSNQFLFILVWEGDVDALLAHVESQPYNIFFFLKPKSYLFVKQTVYWSCLIS